MPESTRSPFSYAILRLVPRIERGERFNAGIILFSLLLVFCLFVWDFIFPLATMIGGVAILVWIRFIRFPPIFEGYARKLARERYFTRSKYAHPEATIRTKPNRTTRTGRSTKAAKRRRRR